MDRHLQEHMDMTPGEAARMRLDRYIQAEADRIAALKPAYLVKRTPEGKVESVRALHLERYQEAMEAEAREADRIYQMVMESVADKPQTQTMLTPETLAELTRQMEKDRIRATVWSGVNAPQFTPLPLESPVYELDLEKVCPVCGGLKHENTGICKRCFIKESARLWSRDGDI